MRLRVGRDAAGELAIFDDDVDAVLPQLVVGHYTDDSEAARWAHWYVSKRMMPDDTASWPLEDKLEWYHSDGGPSVLYVVSGEPVGMMGWNGEEWWFYGLEFDLSNAVKDYGEDFDHDGAVLPETWTVFIDADPEEQQHYRDERAQILLKPKAIQPALEAERKGRLQQYRDDTFDIAHRRAVLEARRVWDRRSNRVA